MIIECPACHTRYRTDDSLTITETTLFECSREQCGHVFPYLSRPAKELESKPFFDEPEEQLAVEQPTRMHEVTPLPPPVSAKELKPVLPSVSSEDETEDEPFSLAPPPRPSSSSPSGLTPLATHDIDEDFATAAEDFTLDTPSAPTPISPTMHTPVATTMDNRLRNDPPRRPIPNRPRQRSVQITTFSVWPALGLLVLLVVGYYLLGNRWKTNLADTENMLARLPVVGSSFVASQFSPQHITLSDVKSGFWITKDSKRVFAISGKATNTAPVPASIIQIEGQLHDIDGGTIEQRIISCGMGTTAESLPTLTTHEISVLQGLVPPKQFHVPPGQTVNFLIVFPNPPTTITELSCRVATAQFSTS